MSSIAESVNELPLRGYTLLEGVFDRHEAEHLTVQLNRAFQRQDDPSVLRSRGRVYGCRNLITAFPQVLEIPKRPRLAEFIKRVLGGEAGLVRGLFFDKPPERSWSLPWHRDRTIAVQRNDLCSDTFQKPTMKAGMPHVEAPDWLLASMITLRLHLDAMTAENGPLSVIPGSHLLDESAERPPVELEAEIGDVLAMRPLISHCSSNSREGTNMHRRIIHLEFASSASLSDGYQWHSFFPIS